MKQITYTIAHQILGQSVLWTQAEAIGRVVGDWFQSIKEKDYA